MIRPTEDRVVVDVDIPEAISKGGIVLPDAAKERPQEGVIVAVGPGRIDFGELVEMRLKVKDRVLFPRYSGVEVKVGDRKYLILGERDILAIL